MTSKNKLAKKLEKAQTAASDAAGELVVEKSRARTLEDENGGLKVALSVAASELKAAASPPSPAAPAAAPPPPPPATPLCDAFAKAKAAGASELELSAMIVRDGPRMRGEQDALAAHGKTAPLQTSAGVPPGAAPPAPPRAPDGTFRPATPMLDRLHALPSDLERATYMANNRAALEAEVAATRGAGR